MDLNAVFNYHDGKILNNFPMITHCAETILGALHYNYYYSTY